MTKKTILESKTFKEGEIIYSHSDPSKFIYLIESGEVKILTKHGLQLAILKEGEIFGEVGHIIETPRTTEFKICHKKWVPKDKFEQNLWSIDLKITEINKTKKQINKFLLTYGFFFLR